MLDTNILSELFRPEPSADVMAWLKARDADELFTSAIARVDMLFGAHTLTEGQRKDPLLAGRLRNFDVCFPNHVLPYDEATADAHAEIAAQRRAQGRPGSHADLMIAGIARSHDATLATRNVRDFEDCGIALIDPWH